MRFYQQVFGVEINYRDAGSIQVTTPGCHDVIVFDQTAAHGEYSPVYPFAYVKDPDGYEIQIGYE